MQVWIEVLDLLAESLDAARGILAIVFVVRFFTSAIVILFRDLIKHAYLPV